jgi:hypothetical protein
MQEREYQNCEHQNDASHPFVVISKGVLRTCVRGTSMQDLLRTKTLIGSRTLNFHIPYNHQKNPRRMPGIFEYP